jgi:hypothetical protein
MATRNQILQAIADAEEMELGSIDAGGLFGQEQISPRVFPETENLIPPFMEEPSGMGEGYDRTGFRFPNVTGIMSAARDKLAPMLGETPEKLAAYEAIMGDRKNLGLWDTQTGTYGGTEYDLQQTPGGLKVYSDLNPFGSNLYSGRGSESLEEMEQKKLDWSLGRLRTGKGLSTHLRNILRTRGYDERGNLRNFPDRGPQFTERITDTVNIPHDTTTVGGYEGPQTYDFNRAQFARSGGQRADKPGGFTDPGRGSYGPHRGSGRAEGGRIGYQEGELVEDEYMAEATPGGMMEENIEEVQGEPSREQLEAIALEIFRLPLEQLNEEQLNVVYQAAMEQEPSEEEVQFAAQEGPGEGIASLV